MTKNDKNFRIPSWIVLLIGAIADGIIYIVKSQIFTITIFHFDETNEFIKVPMFFTVGLIIFFVLNFLPLLKKAFEKRFIK